MQVTLEGKNDGPTNMERDAALLEQANHGDIIARVYFWDSVWVTLGHSQKPEDALLDLSVNHIIRPTGGAAVLHGHDLTLAVAMPLTYLECSSREVKKAFFGLTAPILQALNKSKIPAILGRDLNHLNGCPRSDEPRIANSTNAKKLTPYCFGSKSDYDVLNAKTGEKICGCAMKVTAQAALLQASIPFQSPLIDPVELLKLYIPTPTLKLDPIKFFDNFSDALMAGSL